MIRSRVRRLRHHHALLIRQHCLVHRPSPPTYIVGDKYCEKPKHKQSSFGVQKVERIPIILYCPHSGYKLSFQLLMYIRCECVINWLTLQAPRSSQLFHHIEQASAKLLDAIFTRNSTPGFKQIMLKIITYYLAQHQLFHASLCTEETFDKRERNLTQIPRELSHGLTTQIDSAMAGRRLFSALFHLTE